MDDEDDDASSPWWTRRRTKKRTSIQITLPAMLLKMMIRWWNNNGNHSKNKVSSFIQESTALSPKTMVRLCWSFIYGKTKRKQTNIELREHPGLEVTFSGKGRMHQEWRILKASDWTMENARRECKHWQKKIVVRSNKQCPEAEEEDSRLKAKKKKRTTNRV